MAEIIVVAAIKALSSTLAGEVARSAYTYVVNPASLISRVHDKMARIKSDLESIKSLLRFADQKIEMNDDPLVGDWVKKVRDVAYEVGDVLETHMYGVYGVAERKRAFRSLRRELRILATYRETAVELEKIRPSMERIVEIHKDVICSHLKEMTKHEGPIPSSSSGKQHFSSPKNR